MPVSEIRRPALSPAEAADVLGCTRQTVYALIQRRVLNRYKVGRLTRLNTAEVLALIGGDHAPAA